MFRGLQLDATGKAHTHTHFGISLYFILRYALFARLELRPMLHLKQCVASTLHSKLDALLC
jgi:hypothetical protein